MNMIKAAKKKWIPPNVRMSEALRARVADWKPGTAVGTEVALAEEFGVSRMTARKAVERLVKDGLLERHAGIGVFRRDKDKEPRHFRFLAGNLLWDSAIGVMLTFRNQIKRTGAELDLRDAEGDAAKLKEELLALPKSGAVGAGVFSIHEPELAEVIADLVASGFPIVVIDEVFDPKTGVSGFVSDNAQGGRIAAEQFVKAGHRNLAFIGDYVADTVRARWEGFREVAEANGINPVRIELTADDRLGDWAHIIREATRRLLREYPETTGVFCSCDAVARHVMRELWDQKIVVPRDLSVIGFDDDPISGWTSPALTTLHQNFEALGEAAGKALLARYEDRTLPPETVTVPVTLVERGSVGPAPVPRKRR